MKKIFLIAVTFLFLFSIVPVFAVENKFSGIGAWVIKDQMNSFNNKTFVAYVAPNAPASVLPIGTEIIKVNKIGTKNLSIKQITDLIHGETGTEVTLLVKYPNKKKAQVVLKRAVIEIPASLYDSQDFTKYWSQVAPSGFLNMDKIPDEVLEQMSYPYYLACKYWKDRKAAFKAAYDVCKSYPKNEQNLALENLVAREQNRTASDRQNDIQANMLRQQRIQNFTNTMNQIQTNNELNSINNSLQQQNFQLQNTNMQLHNINNTLRGW